MQSCCSTSALPPIRSFLHSVFPIVIIILVLNSRKSPCPQPPFVQSSLLQPSAPAMAIPSAGQDPHRFVSMCLVYFSPGTKLQPDATAGLSSRHLAFKVQFMSFDVFRERNRVRSVPCTVHGCHRRLTDDVDRSDPGETIGNVAPFQHGFLGDSKLVRE